MTENLQNICEQATNMINSYPEGTRIRVISHYDADGICAAAILSKALYRAGYNFHTTLMRNPFDKGLERVSKEENELTIFSDMGSGQIDTIEKMPGKSIILDHHQLLKEKTSKKILQINANQCGINGNYEACGATLAYTLAKTIDKKNIDLIALAIAGATGDKQYIGGIRGYNKTILEEGLKNNILEEKTKIKLYNENLFDALFYSIDPYYSGISGDKKGVNELLNNLKFDKNKKFEGLSDNGKKKLQSFLLLKLIKKNCEKNILDTIIRPRYYSSKLGCELERFADLLDACGKGGNRGVALSIALGDKESFKKALELEKEYKQKILDELIRLEEEGFKDKKNFYYFFSRDSSLGGVINGIAINYILGIEKPLISIVHKNNELHISCRGNQYLVSKGLDLGDAMKQASQKLGGHGGGHAIASGATISKDKEEEFLDLVDKIIEKQLKR